MKLTANASKYAAEAIATFSLVFAGTAAIASNEMSGGAVSHVGISLVFGLIVLAMVYAVGPISGAHMNPAVTIAFSIAGRMRWKEAIAYIGSQLGGALTASLAVRFIFPSSETIGMTHPSGAWGQSFALEFVLTFILMFVIMGVAHDDRAEGLMAGVAIGATVALEALLGGPVSGASMNPARSIAPALVSGQFRDLWIYCAAPVVGSIAGAWTYLSTRPVSPALRRG